MSFILDALKKSEAERQRQAGPALLEMRVVRPRRSIPGWVLAGGGALLLINLVLVGWLILRARPESAASTPATAAGASTRVAPVAAPTIITLTPPASVGGEPPRIVAGGAAPGAVVVPGDGPAAGDAVNPADLAPAESERGSITVGRDPSALQSYNEVSGKMPEVHLDLHVYSPNAAERYAFINLHKVREGETTAEGMRVIEITSGGVVLQYQGTEFMLGRN
jgi:general secretion pathway protein B